jgi:hypothetical protein
VRAEPAAQAVATEATPRAAGGAAARDAAPAAPSSEGQAAAPAGASTALPGPLRPAAPPTAALSDDPSALCGRRVLLALAWCMERECARADQKDHPACRKWFATNRQRPNP